MRRGDQPSPHDLLVSPPDGLRQRLQIRQGLTHAHEDEVRDVFARIELILSGQDLLDNFMRLQDFVSIPSCRSGRIRSLECSRPVLRRRA